MDWSRVYHTSTLLHDGRVLIAGGDGCPNPKRRSSDNSCLLDATSDTLSSAELYDPTTGEFTPAGSMFTARSEGSATLPDGRVLMVGISAANPETAELYDPEKGVFVRTGSEPGFYSVQATLLRSGKVLLTGDQGRGELFDPATGHFVPAEFAMGPDPIAAALLPDGRVAIVYASGQVETYDPSTGATAYPPSLSFTGDWTHPTVTPLADGSVLFNDPVTGPHVLAGPSIPQGGQSATLLPDGNLLLAGGTPDNQTTSSAVLLIP
jgi:hypothetical protein